LLDYPLVLGSRPDQASEVLELQPVAHASYADGPRWNGVFDPDLVAVLSIRAVPLDPRTGACSTGRFETAPITDLQLVFSGQDPPLSLPGAVLRAGPCRPAIFTFAYDSNDA
jgi:hypothetical protein